MSEGLSIHNTTCVISGTPTSALASTSYTVTATNSAGTATANLTLSMTCSWVGNTEFVSMPTNNNCFSSIASNQINGVYVADGTIYAATSGGPSISANNGASFINRTTAQGLGSNYVHGVYADGSTIYAANLNGLNFISSRV